MNKHLHFILFLPACAVLFLVGCRSAQMPLADEFTGAQRLDVEGRQGFKIKENLRFGTFDAVEIDRSWVKGSDLQIMMYEGNKRFQRYNFLVREAGQPRWRVECEAFLRERTVTVRTVDIDVVNRSSLTCQASDEGSASTTWSLRLTEREQQALTGTLEGAGSPIYIAGTKELAGGLPGETESGYTISNAAGPVAAVEVVNNGAVWFLEDQGPPEDILAAAAAALLLLEDLRAYLPG